MGTLLYTYQYTEAEMRPIPSVVVDRSSPEPVYVQIARSIRARICSGEIASGTPLAPVRTVASDLGVNLNTVARAYRLLEDEGFVQIRSRSGVEVAPPAGKSDREAVERLQEDLAAVLARMRQAGVAPAELRRRAEKEIGAIERLE